MENPNAVTLSLYELISSVLGLAGFALSIALAVREWWKTRARLEILDAQSWHITIDDANVLVLRCIVYNPSSCTVSLSDLEVPSGVSSVERQTYASLRGLALQKIRASYMESRSLDQLAILDSGKHLPLSLAARTLEPVVLLYKTHTTLPALTDHQALLHQCSQGLYRIERAKLVLGRSRRRISFFVKPQD